MFDVGTSDGVGVEWLDVKDNGNDVRLEPQACAQIRGLDGRSNTGISHDRGVYQEAKERTSLRRLSVTPAPRNLQRCSVEKARRVWRT